MSLGMFLTGYLIVGGLFATVVMFRVGPSPTRRRRATRGLYVLSGIRVSELRAVVFMAAAGVLLWPLVVAMGIIEGDR